MAEHWQITILARCLSPTVELRNVWYVSDANGPSFDPVIAGQQIQTTYADNLVSNISDQVSFYGFTYQRVDGFGHPMFTDGTNQFDGEATTQLLPMQTSLLVNFRSVSMRPNQSRKYLFGFTEVENVDAAPSAGLLVNAVAWAQDVLALQGTLGGDQGVIQCLRRNPSTGEVQAAFPISTFVLSPMWATQRRRRPGVGI